MPAILTLTMNPAVDVFTTTDRVLPAHKLRCTGAQMHPGGGGINVARVLHRLGADVLALCATGGVTGQVLCGMLAQEQVPHQALAIAGATRESFTAHEAATGQDFRFVLPGPQLAPAEWQACLDWIAALPTPPRWLVASGSLPPGVPDDFYARLARLANARGMRVVLDSSGPALAAALAEGVFLVKPSLRELRELTGQPLATETQWLGAARGLIAAGQARLVALSLGDQGALLVSATEALRAPALAVTVASTIGAGDSFVAGLVWALDQPGTDPAQALAQALRYGMAAGAAALLGAGTALGQRADVQRLCPQVVIQPAT